MNDWELLQWALEESWKESGEKQRREYPPVTTPSLVKIIRDMEEWEKNRQRGE